MGQQYGKVIVLQVWCLRVCATVCGLIQQATVTVHVVLARLRLKTQKAADRQSSSRFNG